MTKVLVLAGGKSDEREVSLRSGAAVKAALIEAGYQVEVSDTVTDITAEIVRDCEVIFPVLHGAGGEDGSIQTVLDSLGKAYVGSDVAASALCFDKPSYKQLLQKHGLPVPKGSVVSAANFQKHPLTDRPYVLKPYNGGSSVDTYIVRDPALADLQRMETSLQNYGEMLLEELIAGTEITAAVLGDEALPVIEIIPPADGEFDYENKYNGLTQELCPPQHVAPSVQAAAQTMALEIHKLTGCRDLSRTDFIVTPSNELRVLETNTLPGMTNQSLLPKAAAKAGISMPKLVDQLVHVALLRLR